MIIHYNYYIGSFLFSLFIADLLLNNFSLVVDAKLAHQHYSSS